MKMMEGDWARAWAKRSLTRAGPTPTNISMKSEPAIDRKGTFASPAVALAAHSMMPSHTCLATAHGMQSLSILQARGPQGGKCCTRNHCRFKT